MFVSLAYAATVALLSLRSFVYASPLVPRAGQGVWNPHVTAPGAGDVWTVGSTQLVTWDTDDIPPSAMGRTGTLLLGYFDEGTHGENLDTCESEKKVQATCVHLSDRRQQIIPLQRVSSSPTVL